MKIAFRADNDLDRDIVRGLLRLQPDISFESSPLDNLDDATVLRIAHEEGRVLVTHDISTIPPLFAQLRARRPLCGVIVVPQNFPIGQAIERLLLLWSLTEADEWPSRICYLPTLDDFVL